MSYLCKDCSYRGKSSGQEGACPACGSFNIGRIRRDDTVRGSAPGKIRLALLIVLWTWLLAMIAWKLEH